MRETTLCTGPPTGEDACVSVADAISDTPAGGLVRRVRLPNDRRTPAAARALVRSVLEEAGLESLLNEALLLTTELSTNAVVHANTELDIEVRADTTGLTVTVTDFAPGPVEQLAVGPRNESVDIGEVAERGRGLLLVDHFASRWGTVHEGTGKGVWFRLEAEATDRAGAVVPAVATVIEDDTPSVGALTMLLQVNPERHSEEGVAEFAADLLAQLARLTGAAGGVIRLDRGDGGGRHLLARYGRAPRDDADTIRVPLTVQRPYSGELELDASPIGFAQPLATLVAERFSLHLENDRLRRTDLRRQTWLTFLAEASELLAQSLDVNLTMALIPQLVVPRLGQWCAVHTTDAWGRLQLAAATHTDESALPQLHETLAETGPDSILTRLEEASRLGTQVMLGAPTEGFAVPLVARGTRLGTLAVGRHHRIRHDADEVNVLEDVARRAALAIDNARIHDERHKVARTLQASLLPPALPKVEGIGFAAEYVPTGSEVGGDFYDVVPAGPDSWIVVVGDVSGKGVQAATVTGLVRDVIRILVDDGKPMVEILCRVNKTLVQRGGGRYCTLAMASVTRSQGGVLDVGLHLAGHDRAVLVHADGKTAFVGEGGTALGLLESITSPDVAVRLQPGDSLIFYTDGVTERRRGRELFGTARLRDAAGPLAGYSAEVMAARLRSTTINFSVEEPRDDIAILVLRNDA
ncbi:SpoIIE family protein phosphatase [Paractinoplanes abujensis]|uniref:SpoIIE family protein phosphatase n=1 Tax=Paractinoplanes abujensis TaxID=882441 RepID=UPI0016221DFC